MATDLQTTLVGGLVVRGREVVSEVLEAARSGDVEVGKEVFDSLNRIKWEAPISRRERMSVLARQNFRSLFRAFPRLFPPTEHKEEIKNFVSEWMLDEEMFEDEEKFTSTLWPQLSRSLPSLASLLACCSMRVFESFVMGISEKLHGESYDLTSPEFAICLSQDTNSVVQTELTIEISLPTSECIEVMCKILIILDVSFENADLDVHISSVRGIESESVQKHLSECGLSSRLPDSAKTLITSLEAPEISSEEDDDEKKEKTLKFIEFTSTLPQPHQSLPLQSLQDLKDPLSLESQTKIESLSDSKGSLFTRAESEKELKPLTRSNYLNTSDKFKRIAPHSSTSSSSTSTWKFSSSSGKRRAVCDIGFRNQTNSTEKLNTTGKANFMPTGFGSNGNTIILSSVSLMENESENDTLQNDKPLRKSHIDFGSKEVCLYVVYVVFVYVVFVYVVFV
jgi:hypothetical protein